MLCCINMKEALDVYCVMQTLTFIPVIPSTFLSWIFIIFLHFELIPIQRLKNGLFIVMQTWVWIPLITFLSYPNTSRLQAYEALIGYLGYKMREEGREFGSGEGVWVAGGRWVLQDLYFEKYSVDNRQDGRKRDIGWNREFIAEF